MTAPLLTKLTKAVLDLVPPARGYQVIEVGSGLEAPYQAPVALRAKRYVMIDAHQPYLDANRVKAPSVARICGVAPGVLDRFAAREFDLALMVDVIEHLEKADALKTLEELRRVADAIAIFTPDGFLPQNVDAYQMGADTWQTHRSGWTGDELQALGFHHIEQWQLSSGDMALWAEWKRAL